jgi:3'-5' exoribonuclease
MAAKSIPVLTLAATQDGQEADWFVFLSRKEEHKTREGKPYFRVTFKDASRESTIPIWNDSPWYLPCTEWETGQFYKVRGTLKESQYGSQLELKKIRPAIPEDIADGYDPLALLPSTKYNVVDLFNELLQMAREHIQQPALVQLIEQIFRDYREQLLEMPAAVHHHHAFRGGFLEHVHSVTRNAIFLAQKYGESYPEVLTQNCRDLVIAGAMLHDIGKLQELITTPGGAIYSAAGELIGHAVLGRDLIRKMAELHAIPPDILLRLEHIVVSHQRTPEWGAPKPPMTLEALLVYYADDLDARAQMLVEALEKDHTAGIVTSTSNALKQKVFRG